MKISDDLFQLIQSMNTAEKRHFKLFSSRYRAKNGNNYLQLFDAINGQREYKEEVLKAKFKGKSFIRNLPAEKIHLYAQIMESLHEFHGESSTESRLHKIIHQLEILYARGLFDQFVRLLVKTKQKAKRAEKFIHLLSLLKLEQRLIGMESICARYTIIPETLYQEEQLVLQQLQEINHYRHANEQLYAFFRNRGNARTDEAKQYFTQLLTMYIYGREPVLSVAAQDSRYVFLSTYYWGMDDAREAMEYSRKRLELYESHSEYLIENPLSYITVLTNYALDCLHCGEIDTVLVSLRKSRTMPTVHTALDTRLLEAKMFRAIVPLELYVYASTGRFEEGYALCKDTEKQLQALHHDLEESKVAVIYYLLAYLCFGMEQYRETLRYLDALFTLHHSTSTTDAYCTGRILYLLTHYELGNNDLLEYAVVSVYRFLKKKDRLYPTEEILLAHLRKLPAVYGEREIKEYFRALRNDLGKESEEASGQKYLDIRAWLDSKIEGKNFRELARHAGLEKLTAT